MTAYWTQGEHAEDYDGWVNDLLINAPESYDGDTSAEDIVTHYVHDLEEALADARKVIVFADGLAFANTDFRLTDLYAGDCVWAQRALAGAGLPIRLDAGEEPLCHPLVPDHESALTPDGAST